MTCDACRNMNCSNFPYLCPCSCHPEKEKRFKTKEQLYPREKP